MLLTLYKQNGDEKATLSPNDTSRQEKEVQGDNVLSLSFTLYEYVSIDVNDYVVFDGERYWAVEKYLPAEKSTVEWEYNVKLYGVESLIKRLLVLNNADGEMEAVFSLTAKPVEHMRLIVANINEGLGSEGDWMVGAVVGTENVVIDYTGKYCDEALKELAGAVGAEWWIEGTTVNLCRCERGEELTLGYGEGLLSLDRDRAEGAKFYTRLFPIGSSRNIDQEAYGASRLQLPDGKKYVDVEGMVEKYGVIHHYEREAFSGIYPRRVGEVGSVRSEEVMGRDGNLFTIYYFKDDDLLFDPNDYEIGDLVKHVTFETGELAGRDFEVNYDSERHEFEIVTTWPFDDETQLPGGSLVPEARDRYVLWNIRMPDEYYGLAEAEFEDAVEEYNMKHALDLALYKAPTDHVWIENEGVELYIGRRVRLVSEEYFPEGEHCRSSRITRISRRVTLPSEMDLEISDALSMGTLEKIGDAISDVKNYTGALVGGMNVPDIIRSWETTQGTDNNLYSARRCDMNYWRRDQDIASAHDISGRRISASGDGVVGGDLSVDGGVTVKGDAGTVWGDGAFERGTKGAAVWKGQDGWHGQLDYLFVARKFTVKDLEVMHERHVGGALVLSGASCVAELVEQETDLEVYRVWFLAEDGDGRRVYNLWKAGDLARCQTANLSVGVEGMVGNHFFWRVVKEVSERPELRADGRLYHWIRLWDRSGLVAEESDAPLAGDEIVQMGSMTDVSRQGVIMLAAVVNGEVAGVPYVRIYRGVGSVERDGDGRVTRGMFELPSARIDLNPLDPHLDVASLSITASGGGAKTIDQYIREREPEGVMVISGDSEDAPGVDDEFIGECLEVLGLSEKAEMVGAFYVTTEWRIWKYGAEYVWTEVTDTNLRDILDEMREIEGLRSEVVLRENFASMVSEAVRADGTIATKAEVRTEVEGAMSQVSVCADRVTVESGSETLGNYFSIDGETGNLHGQNLRMDGEIRASVLYEGFGIVLLGSYAPAGEEVVMRMVKVGCEPHVEVRGYLNEERTGNRTVKHGLVLPYAGDCEGKVVRIHGANVLKDLTRSGYWNAPVVVRAMGTDRAGRIAWYRTNRAERWADALEEQGNERAACEALDEDEYGEFLVDVSGADDSQDGDFGLMGTTWTFPAVLMCAWGVCVNATDYTAYLTDAERVTSEVELIAYRVGEGRYGWRVYRQRNVKMVAYGGELKG